MIDVDAFLADGFTMLERPWLRAPADAARAALWAQLGMSPDDPAGWIAPVAWAADLTGAGPFGALVHDPALDDVLDQLCGAGGWQPRGALGNVPVRFPVTPAADDRGWHLDANTPTDDGSWCVSARPHTLLVLTLLSEVGPDDAPTRLRVGSHRDVPAVLGDRRWDPFDAGPVVDAASAHRPIARATGRPGDVYLVHPFTVHAAGEHRGGTPRFMAQGPVMLAVPLSRNDPTPLARALRV